VPSAAARLLLIALLLAGGDPARAAGSDERARAVVQVVALGAPDFAVKGGPGPLATAPAVAGSGVIVSPDCVIVTNHHVVAQATAVAVRFPGEARLQAVAVAYLAPDADLAVLLPERARCPDFVPVPAAAELPPVGATVIKIGYGGDSEALALRTRRPTVARGAVVRPAVAAGAPVLAAYVPVDPGDSGGLVCDEEGRLVGVTRGHHRARTGTGYAVPAATVAAALRDGRPGVERARARVVRPAWGYEVVGAETAAEVAAAGGEPDAVLRLVRERGAALALLAAAPPGLGAAARLIGAAMVWDLGVARFDDSATRADGCRLLGAAVELVRQARADDRGLRQSPFEDQLEATLADVRRGERCGAAGPAPAPAGRVAAGRAAGGARLVAGEQLDLYARWVVTIYRSPGRTGASAGGVEPGAFLPLVERGPVRLGLVLGYSFVSLDRHARLTVHRIDIPVRFGYRWLFVDAGVAACVSDVAPPGEASHLRAGAGFLLRAGARKKLVEAGVTYVNLPVGAGRLQGGQFFAGLVW
jgi:S1-C subfamily serine protease